jgi:hypothetical protein
VPSNDIAFQPLIIATIATTLNATLRAYGIVVEGHTPTPPCYQQHREVLISFFQQTPIYLYLNQIYTN